MGKLIETKNLTKYYKTPNGILHGLDDVNISIEEGKTVGVVGESGCGKSTLGRVLLHLTEATSGQIFYRGEDITYISRKKLGDIRTKMQIVFQDPYSSLDPRMYVEAIIGEGLKNRKVSQKEVLEKTLELMDTVEIPRRMRYAYPHELNGGLRQRVVIARALSMNPEFIVCDEPVSALDVSIQAQVLNLLKELQQKKGLTYLFITHDMSVVQYMADEICVMYLGEIIEYARTKDLFELPLHPYTKALLDAVPDPVLKDEPENKVIGGELMSPVNPPKGCRFAPRCPFASEECKKKQVLTEAKDHHFVACHKYKSFIQDKRKAD